MHAAISIFNPKLKFRPRCLSTNSSSTFSRSSATTSTSPLQSEATAYSIPLRSPNVPHTPEHAHLRQPRVPDNNQSPYSSLAFASHLSLNQCCTPPQSSTTKFSARKMGLTKSQRITILLGIDAAFFLLELVVGYAVHSLALVADAFHMLNDVLSLCVGLWAVRIANTGSSKMYTYGWQRAETLGALINGIFLVALCLSIFLEAIQRFVEPQVVSKPILVLIVGCFGLASNILGLFLFHDHGHSHGGEGHSHGNDAHSHAEEGHAHSHAHGNGHSHEPTETTRLIADEQGNIEDVLPSVRVAGASSRSKSLAQAKEKNGKANTSRKASVGQITVARHRRRTSGYCSVDELPIHPGSFRQGVIRASQVDEESEPDSEEAVTSPQITRENSHHRHGHSHDDHDDDESYNHDDEADRSRIHDHYHGYGSVNKHQSPGLSHENDNHNKKKDQASGGGGHGHGHSHGDLNMQGVFLHVLGDALGNIGVIASALIIWLTPWSFRYYFDPGISLIITVIILTSAIPLCKAASRILLQAVPAGLSIDEIKQDIETLTDVTDAHHLHVWQLSDTKLVASLHVQVKCEDEGMGSAKYMRLVRAIRKCLHKYGIHSSTIQPEFVHGSDATTAADESSGSGTAALPPKHIGSQAGSVNSRSCMLDCGDDCKEEGCCPPGAEGKDQAAQK